jgi:hypothetical protein
MMTDTQTQLEQELADTVEPRVPPDQIATPVSESVDGALTAEGRSTEEIAVAPVEPADATDGAAASDSIAAEAPPVPAPEPPLVEEAATEPTADAPTPVSTPAAAEAFPDIDYIGIPRPTAITPDADTGTAVTSESVVAASEETAAQKLARLEERVLALADEVRAAANRATFLGRVRRAMAQVPAELGEEATALRTRLGELEAEILEQIEERRKLKEAIVERAEALALSNEWKATGEAMRGLFDQWKAIGSAGHEVEDALWKRFQGARDTFSQRRNEWFEGRQKEWAANREKKEALCARAEALSESTEWRATADAMRNLMAEWRTIGSAGRESDDALWSRFRAAQQIFFDRRSATYNENHRRKEEICAQAEEVKDSTDWRGTAEMLKGLQAAWKEIGPVGSRDLEDRLWNRFRAATQSFFDRRGSSLAERERDEADNLRRKEELCVAIEALAVAADPVAATEEAKALQAEWKTIGPVRRDRGDALWARFRAGCDRVFENAVAERARRQVAWSTKMREALLRKEEQLARLEEAITLDEQTVQRWQSSLATRPDEGVVAKIADTRARISEKRARAAELKSSIDDILAKMKH